MGQVLLTLFVALLVFGPTKLPMLAKHLGQLVARFERLKQQTLAIWHDQLNNQLLQENQQKAQQADIAYQDIRKHNE